jgi:hypothetical protein
MKYEATGQILVIHDTQTFTSGFQKREFVLKVPDGKYPQEVKFEVLKDNCDLLDRVRIGDEITAHFNIRGNEHNGRHYVNLVAWRLERPGGRQEQPPSARPESHEDSSEIPF